MSTKPKILRPKPVLTYPLTDRQTIFDYVFHHFVIDRNPKGMRPDNTFSCVYDTPTGGCAVGCLLPDELRSKIGYTAFGIGTLSTSSTQACELRAAHSFFDDLYKVFGFTDYRSIDASRENRSLLHLLRALQAAHDGTGGGPHGVEFAENFAERLKQLAPGHCLTLPVQY